MTTKRRIPRPAIFMTVGCDGVSKSVRLDVQFPNAFSYLQCSTILCHQSELRKTWSEGLTQQSILTQNTYAEKRWFDATSACGRIDLINAAERQSQIAF